MSNRIIIVIKVIKNKLLKSIQIQNVTIYI